jgi:hypothetical protein
VTQVSKGRTVIEFSGTAGLVRQAFGTAIHRFAVKGEEHWANVSDPYIPTALAPIVAGLDSLHNFEKKAQNKFLGTYSEKSKQLTSPVPNFTFNGGCTPPIGNCYALVPYDFATIYDLLPLWNAATPINGTGQISSAARLSIPRTLQPSGTSLGWTVSTLRSRLSLLLPMARCRTSMAMNRRRTSISNGQARPLLEQQSTL